MDKFIGKGKTFTGLLLVLLPILPSLGATLGFDLTQVPALVQDLMQLVGLGVAWYGRVKALGPIKG